jgi:hypothetical protein
MGIFFHLLKVASLLLFKCMYNKTFKKAILTIKESVADPAGSDFEGCETPGKSDS